MDGARIYSAAALAASKAKSGSVCIDGKLYTLKFCSREWVYRVYEGDMLVVSFNTKSLATAKRYLREYLSN